MPLLSRSWRGYRVVIELWYLLIIVGILFVLTITSAD